ncbi:hypothetical protein MLD38_005303 [Melastoma candidum]|uniref:Uncharacterized protein n=1 Tax=Melastoma candidum TaxID=119954 RepID=A0ACB9S8G0_9MYRT|nr:hypothetical protein MLD38_005303 [Melastoma candidum]
MLEKFLAEVHMPEQVEVNALDTYMNQILTNDAITFSEDDLPERGDDHNDALFITIKCRDTTISKVLIDGGSGVNIIPLVVAQKLGINTEKLPQSGLSIRAFDGAKRQAHGEVILEIKVGPTLFSSVFQILETAGSFNMLLGRPWIHQAGAVPSTLHQMVRFPSYGKLVTVRGEHTMELCHEIDMPYLGEPTGEPSMAQTLEMVHMVRRYYKSDPLMTWGNISAAKEFIRHGYQPGQGLGARGQGMTRPIRIPSPMGTTALGFEGEVRRKQDKHANDKSFIRFVRSSATTMEGEILSGKLEDIKIRAGEPEGEMHLPEDERLAGVHVNVIQANVGHGQSRRPRMRVHFIPPNIAIPLDQMPRYIRQARAPPPQAPTVSALSGTPLGSEIPPANKPAESSASNSTPNSDEEGPRTNEQAESSASNSTPNSYGEGPRTKKNRTAEREDDVNMMEALDPGRVRHAAQWVNRFQLYLFACR